tara:strand:- start:88 stop:309 length:222 start_codon:yes stop_codon:yes gene_type:complete
LLDNLKLEEEQFQQELNQLFPRKYLKKSSLNIDDNRNSPVKSDNNGENDSDTEEQKLKKRLNFHVLVKNTKLF